MKGYKSSAENDTENSSGERPANVQGKGSDPVI